MGKILIYVISIMFSTFSISGINFENVFKKNHIIEARIFVVIISIIIGYLLGEFIINFLNLTKIM